MCITLLFFGEDSRLVDEDIKKLVSECTFLYRKELNLQNSLIEAFCHTSFAIHHFSEAYENLLIDGSSSFDLVIKQRDESDSRNQSTEDYVVIFNVYSLSLLFGTFLVMVKATLDKLMPLYSYQYKDKLSTFGDKGNKLIRVIERSKLTNKEQLIHLIKTAKEDWIDDLINMRDKFTHAENLNEYQNPWCPKALFEDKSLVQSLKDFNKPKVTIRQESSDALEYMTTIRGKLVQFISDFLGHCEFTKDRRPKFYLSCEHCQFSFAKWVTRGNVKPLEALGQLPIAVISKELGYGEIICPKCGGNTDTDILAWERNLGIQIIT